MTNHESLPQQLLDLGLVVIQSRSRDKDKHLGDWKPDGGFFAESEALYYYREFCDVCAMRVIDKNGIIQENHL